MQVLPYEISNHIIAYSSEKDCRFLSSINIYYNIMLQQTLIMYTTFNHLSLTYKIISNLNKNNYVIFHLIYHNPLKDPYEKKIDLQILVLYPDSDGICFSIKWNYYNSKVIFKNKSQLFNIIYRYVCTGYRIIDSEDQINDFDTIKKICMIYKIYSNSRQLSGQPGYFDGSV